MEVIAVKEAKEYVAANYPNDPLLKHIVLNLLDQLPKEEAIEPTRAYWILKSAGQGTVIYECSNCQANVPVSCDIEYASNHVLKENPFCAKCGAIHRRYGGADYA